MWNTGCNVVFNRTEKRLLYIVDGEDQSRTLLVDSKGEESFKGTIIPWAAKDEEVTSKAFRVFYYTSTSTKKKGWFYLFQDYHTDYVCWADWTSASPYLDGKVNVAPEKASYVDVQIGVTADDEGNLTIPTVEVVKVW